MTSTPAIRRGNSLRALLATTLALIVAACGGGSSGAPPPRGPEAPVVTAPTHVTAGQSGYTASVAARAGLTYEWTIAGGTLASEAGGTSVTFTAGATGVVGLGCVATDASGRSSSAGLAQSTIVAAPAIASFTVDHDSIASGDAARLAWSTTGATTLTIDHGVGDASKANTASVKPSASTQYTLTATNAAGSSVNATVAVAVDGAPVVSSFKATPSSIAGGASTVLSATFAGGTGVITPGDLALDSGGAVTVAPTADQTYTLTVTNDAGDVATATTTVTITADTGHFTLGAQMVHPRSGHSATLLANGKVLVAGGRVARDGGPLPVLPAELYDPATGAFQESGALPSGRWHPRAVLLADGRVLVAGGWDDSGRALASALIYDPVTGLFTPTGSMATARAEFAMARLADGRVMVIGGDSSSPVSITGAEIYDPATQAFTTTVSLPAGGAGATAVVLGDGRVLVPGSHDEPDLNHMNVAASLAYDPAGRNLAPTGARSQPTADYLAVRLADGRVLVAGGDSAPGVVRQVAELFDPTTNAYTPTGSMLPMDLEPGAYVPLADGSVLVLGRTDQVYDPVTGTFAATDALAIACDGYTATRLDDGTVLVVGGDTDSVTSNGTAQVYH